jgi:hypothetical protein
MRFSDFEACCHRLQNPPALESPALLHIRPRWPHVFLAWLINRNAEGELVLAPEKTATGAPCPLSTKPVGRRAREQAERLLCSAFPSAISSLSTSISATNGRREIIVTPGGSAANANARNHALHLVQGLDKSAK